MDYCAPIGLPHSKFLSWNPDDQDKAMAWVVESRRACHQCGSVSDEWLDEEGRDREPPPFVAKSRYCAGCHAIRQLSEEIPEDRKSFTHIYLEPWSEEWDLSS